MRKVCSADELLHHIEYFVNAVAGYNADFVLFPEFFCAPLMAESNAKNVAEAVRSLADHTDYIREQFVRMALSYNINIIAGSMLEFRNNKLYSILIFI